MSCPTIYLASGVNEDFGAPFSAPQPQANPERRARWRDLPATTGAVVFTDATVVVQTVGGATLVGVGMQSFSFFRPPGAPPLRAAVFRSGSHIVVLNEAQQINGKKAVQLVVFERTGAANPIAFGPFANVEPNVPINVADGKSGQLLLLWHDSNATGIGKTARVMRTDIVYQGSDALVMNINPDQGTPLVFCRITGANRTLALYGNATLAGPDALNTTQAQLLHVETIEPGTLSVAPNALTFADTVSSGSTFIRNAGRDMLEIKGISPSNTTLLDVSHPALSHCLAPAEQMQVTFTRKTPGAGRVEFLITTEPRLPSDQRAEEKIVVTMDAITGAKLEIIPSASLSWIIGDTSRKDLAIRHRGGIPLRISVSAATNGFAWTSSSIVAGATRTMNPGEAIGLGFTPPNGTAASTVTVAATDVNGVAIAQSPLTISLSSGASAKVNPGELRIGAWMIDPPGTDILPEGEFIELENVSGRNLDLSSVVITERVFTSQNTTFPGTGTERAFFTFGATTLNGGAVLPAGKTVRVLTRAKNANDSDDFPPAGAWRVYAGRAAAVWNNTGDTARLVNREGAGVQLDMKVFVRGSNAIPPATPPGAIVTPRHRVPGLSRRYFVNAGPQWATSITLEDGDLVTVRNVTGTITLAWLGGGVGPNGNPGTVALPDEYIPFHGTMTFAAPGLPVGALVAQWRHGANTSAPILIGTGPVTFTIRAMNGGAAPLVLDLGINDSYTDDNSGVFDAMVDVYRS